MEFFEQKALASVTKKPEVWFRYVDDTSAVWRHGEEDLQLFLQHLNSIHPSIQFTMEKESNNQLPFFDVLVTKKEDGTLGHQVYRKPTHTDRYLHKKSNHHPRQKMAVINTLMHRAERICEKTHLKEELKHLELAFQANRFTRGEIRRALHPRRSQNNKQKSTPSEPLGKVFLPYLHRVTDRIGKLLEKHNIKTIFKPTTQLRNCYRPMKDPRDPFSTSGVYKIPCS
ncbi:uncharacterized protein LOC129228027 [Uloborus diversus]|uniref:uncharacterized protein LOC129228027 n=1 Tax=Uloborus diversus TaxID=327109 RepID=UPI00240A298A|nr:uncharacterized protein LOC129228027 [Uloborus diversus]